MGKKNVSASLGIRRTKSVEVEDFASGIAVAEYSSIRSESIQSFATSQSIIQWSLATYGVLFGAGLLAVNNEIADDLAPTVSWMAAIIYGALLPGLVCAAAWSWIGEIRRMERTGAYLRGLELHLGQETMRSSSSVVGPLNWESFLAGDPSVKKSSVKGWAPYLGTAMLFGGSIFASILFFFFWMYQILEAGWTPGVWVLFATGALLLSTFVVVCVHTGIGVVWLGNQYFDLQSRGLLPWRPGRSMASYRRIEVALIAAVFIALAILALCLLPDRILAWK